MKERQTDMVRERKKKRGEGYVVKPKMAACSSKGGEAETLTIGEPFSCCTLRQVSKKGKTGC